MSSPTAEQLSERVSRMIMAMGLIDLTEQDRKLLVVLAREEETAEAAVDLFSRLSRPRHG